MARINTSGASVIALCVAFISASLVAVGLRFLSKQRIRRPMKVHDYLCITSLIFCIAYSIDISIGTVYGDIGKHITEVPLDRLTIALKTFFVSQFFWALSISAFRLSIIFVYIEIFTVGTFFYYAYGMVAIVCLFFIGSITTSLRLCKPVSFSWNKSITGTCGDVGTAELSAAAINLVLDIIIVLLPLPLVWGLNMAKQRKVGLTVTFALGLIVSAINLGRIIQVKICDVNDFTYCTHTAILLTVPEMAIGIVVACVPLLGPLFYPTRYKKDSGVGYNDPNTLEFAKLRDDASKQKSAPSFGEDTTGIQSYDLRSLEENTGNALEHVGPLEHR